MIMKKKGKEMYPGKQRKYQYIENRGEKMLPYCLECV